MGVKNLKIIFLALLFAVNFFFFSEINKLYNKPTNTLFHRITYFFLWLSSSSIKMRKTK